MSTNSPLLVTCHTDHLAPGATFVAIKGFESDGARFIPLAVQRGAARVVVQGEAGEACLLTTAELYDDAAIAAKQTVVDGVAFLRVVDSREALAVLAARAYGMPATKLKIIGVTGTKGKTTTTFIIDYILQAAGFRTALFGSNINRIAGEAVPSLRTTMSADQLQATLAECVRRQVDYVVLEVSSHALSLHRTFGIEFEAAIFTNLTPEHMDFYATMEDYFAAKSLLFAQVKRHGVVVVNADDAYGKRLLAQLRRSAQAFFGRLRMSGLLRDNPLTLSSTKGQDERGLRLYNIELTANAPTGMSFTLSNTSDRMQLRCSSLFGEFNANNAALALVACRQLGVSAAICTQALATFPGVPGRLQQHVLKNGALAFVDYAHNASSFESVLQCLRSCTRHLIVVFGCGGGRVKKRPLMGEIATRCADVVVLTNDNPRFEDPQEIVRDILRGIPQGRLHKVIIEHDRAAAIARAANLAQAGSIIAILGKGHETYYIENGVVTHFDDHQEIAQF